jgi:ribonuclease D
MEYAAADVRHLFALKDRLVDELRAVGRLAWVEEECAALAAQVLVERPPDPDAWMAVKGARELPPRSLTALRELYELRESLARSADRPPFKILAEEILLELARALPADRTALATVRGVTPRVIGRWGAAILAAVQRAQALDERLLPQWPRRPRPIVSAAVSRRVEALRKWRAAATERIGLEPGVLLPNRLIATIAEAAPRSVEALLAIEGVRRWRAEAFGRELVATLERA